jgi:hypothetical protein
VISSQATSVTSLRPHLSAIVACFVFWREICHPTFSDFCNKICHERCGLRAGEVVRLKVKHIDSAQKITRVEQSKGRKDRNVMLRPRRSTCCGNGGGCVRRVTIRENRRKERWLFPSRKTPGRPMTTRQRAGCFMRQPRRPASRRASRCMVPGSRRWVARFLIHVLPAGFHRIRYYGLLARGKRAENIARTRELLTLPVLPVDAIKAANITADEAQTAKHACPRCGGRMLIIERFERGSTPPITGARQRQ